MTRTFAQARVAAVVCALGVSGFGGTVYAQVTIPQEYAKTIKSAEVVGALGDDLFGDQTNFYTGATTFEVTDVSIPGNAQLPVAVGRRFVVEDRDNLKTPGLFGDWELEIPHLHGIFAKTGPSDIGWQVQEYQKPYGRCAVSGNTGMPPDADGSQGGTFEPDEFWNGNSLYIPGAGDQPMMAMAAANPHRPTDGKTYYWLTNNQWFFSCLPTTANGMPGEAFLAVSPEGVRYWFDHIVRRPATILTKSGPAGGAGFAAGGMRTLTRSGGTQTLVSSGSYLLHREEIWILPTRVQDRFNNSVVYTYDGTNPWRVTSISGTEVNQPNRTLTLAYNTEGRIGSVSDGTRTWTYTYNATTGSLEQVTLPDTSKWVYSMYALDGAQVVQRPPGGMGEAWFCDNPSSMDIQSTYTGTITHPSGAVGTFAFKPTRHGRSYVPKHCLYPGGIMTPSDYALFPYLFDTIALQTKSISGPGIPSAYQWTYTYGQPNNSWEEQCSNGCVETESTDVVGPGGKWMRYTFGNRYKSNEGKLLKVETGSGPTQILRTEETTYQLDPKDQAYPAQVGMDPYGRGDHVSERYQPIIEREITQQARTFTWQVPIECVVGGKTVACFDKFARPTKVVKASAPAP